MAIPSEYMEDACRNYLTSLGIDLDATPPVAPKKTKRARGDRWLRTKALAEPIIRYRPRPKSPPAVFRGGRGRLPSRLEYLSRPKKDYSEDFYACPTTSEQSLRDKDKQFRISKRLFQLAKPRPEIPEEIVRRTRFESREQWAAHAKKLETLAAHRREPLSPLEPVRKKVALEKILPRLVDLSQPANRPPNNNERTEEEVFKVKSSTLNYVASDRIKELSIPKKIEFETLDNSDSDSRHIHISWRSKKYIPSDRLIELSKPIYRVSPIKEEVKPDAFNVNRKALKARCSARLKRLSMPVKRD